MAEAPRNRLPSGYEEDFVNTLEDEILCLICHLPQKGPVLTACGHRFCKDCLEEHFRRQEGQPLTCPADRQTLIRDKDIFADKATERKILSFIIKCPRDVPCTNKNCLVTVKRKDLSEHVDVTCEWRIIKCEHCREPHPKCQIEDHIQKTCKLCPIPCPYKCGALILKKQELQDHLETCEHFPVKCPNNCEAVISREMVPNHIDDDCPLTKIPCPYARLGCSKEVQKDQLESHLQLETRSHLDLACFELNDTQEKLNKKTIQLDGLEERVEVIQQQHQYNVNFRQQEYQEKVRILEQNVNATQTKLEQKLKRERKIFFACLLLSLVCLMLCLTRLEDRVQKNLEEKISVIQSLHEKNVRMVKKDLEGKIDSLNTKLEEKVNAIESQHEKSVRMVKKNLEDKVDSLNTRLKLTEESGMFTWKITSFANKLRQAKNKVKQNEESDPFYMFGYKFKLWLGPNGGGSGENTHLSIYIVIMKGEYDAILPWPFKKKVKFTLIDQHENLNERENVTKQFIPDNRPQCFARPTEKENIGYGFETFISHEEINSRRYLVDDTLFFQVEVGLNL